jgi:putative membrane protein
MFVDYLTVMMVSVVAGAVVTIIYGLMFLDAPLADQRPWGWAFGVVGLLLGVTGLHLVLTWPLPGVYNIVMGEPALYFGLVLLGTAFAIRAGESLMPLAVLAFFGGLASIFLSIAMLVYGLSRNPPLWAIAYAAIGLAAVLSPLVIHRVRALRWTPLVAGVLLAIGALIFALGGYGAYLEHTSAEGGFDKWVPPAMREGP